jgi:hypothetical protein
VGNLLSAFFGPTIDPVEQAFAERGDVANAVLIVGGGALCANRDDNTHRRHPAHAVTLALPDGVPQSMYVQPDFEEDITQPGLATRLGFADTYDLIHFENVDVPVVSRASTIANARAMLKAGGLIFIETGGAHAEHTVAVISARLEEAGFLDISASTTSGVQIVAMKNPG